jgi:hypothetical protein
MGKLTQSRKRAAARVAICDGGRHGRASMSGISICMRRATPPPGEASEGDPTR